tara:strand:- start:159 stop:557 length:399 start_codon:yes stop_codon:yes gene_type:complete
MDSEILNIASDTVNNRNIEHHTHYSKLKNSICGDEIQIKLIIKNDKIIDFGYLGSSCIYCKASASLLAKISINSKKTKINKLCDDVKSYFDGNFKIVDKKWLLLKKIFTKKNLSRKNCILLPFKTLKKIVSN